ncbi:thioesterase II family protein [Streptomyces sp. yr375]|uniref:thioesterase II family protein n=1 Tax=Streptomyces sp. yr375 TaxID=1761906 RepID=UPI00210ED4DA|nr:alpha/beta fold hydrolase [Streptomyces sp. yr375]
MENRWITGRLTAGAPRVRLICLPQAGGGAGAFSSWRAHLPEGVELAPVELPGRGTREADPMPARFDDLVDALYKGLLPELDVPYVLFGHSFGGTLAYELTLRIEERGAPIPLATLVSASRAPQTPPTGTISDAPDKELLAWLVNSDGLPRELLKYPDYVAYLLRTIRTDLAFAERYLVSDPRPVRTPLHALCGEEDQVVTAEQVRHWKECAAGGHSFTVMPGGHSYHQTHAPQLMEFVREILPADGTPEEERP